MNLCNELISKYRDLYISEDKCRLYSKAKDKRYYYYRELCKPEKLKATIIMLSPSEKSSCVESNMPDDTINNVNNILKKIPIRFLEEDCMFSSYEIINIYPNIACPLHQIIKQGIDELNKQILEYVIDKAEIIIPAWGVEEKFNEKIKELLKEIKGKCKRKNVFIITNKYPCHFGVQCTSLNRKPEFVEYKFN